MKAIGIISRWATIISRSREDVYKRQDMNWFKTDDIRIQDIEPLISPAILIKDYPATTEDVYKRQDLSRLRAAGYAAPMTSLEDGVRRYVQEYLDREDSYV